MSSVTQRIAQIKQPRGGYLPLKNFQKIQLPTLEELLTEEENISPSLVGLCVDILTRIEYSDYSVEELVEIFNISISGAILVDGVENGSNYKKVCKLIKLIAEEKSLTNKTILSVCYICSYDVAYRSRPSSYKELSEKPSNVTLENIRIMVERTKRCLCLDEFGEIKKFGFSFEGGYSSIITSGDGDLLTKNVLLDFKCLSSQPTSKHTCQILVYYLMGLHSDSKSLYEDLKELALFNPRSNTLYLYPVVNISQEIIDVVNNEVIGYGKTISQDLEEHDEMNVEQVAEYLSISKNQVYKLLKNNAIASEKKGNRYCISKKSVDDYIVTVRRNTIIQISVAGITIILMLGFFAYFIFQFIS